MRQETPLESWIWWITNYREINQAEVKDGDLIPYI